MNLYVSGKSFFKESKEVQKAIVSGVTQLYSRIQSYEKQNIAFDRIFNDDKVKYDKHGQFYTFKFQKSNMQIRILYSYLVIDEVSIIVIADFFIKKKNSKTYIGQFDFVNEMKPLDIYNNSKLVCAI